jgi:hypothetical protein
MVSMCKTVFQGVHFIAVSRSLVGVSSSFH